MNLLEKICEELGVEVGEEWVGNDGYTYKIEGSFLYRKASNSDDWGIVEKECYWKLLVGGLKPKWKPKYGEAYQTPELDNYLKFSSHTWYNGECDNLLTKRGLIFKTKEEAIAAANKMLNALKEE